MSSSVDALGYLSYSYKTTTHLQHSSLYSKPELDRFETHLVFIFSKGRERFVSHDSMALCIRDMAKVAGIPHFIGPIHWIKAPAPPPPWPPQTSKDSDFIAAITPTPSSLARYHSAASPEASAALLAAPRPSDMAKAAGAYAKFENPDQFRAVGTDN